MVMLSHLWMDLNWWQGAYAVQAFYVVSGYLMTLVLNEVYTGASGKLAYVINRLLRIYPLYIAAVIAGVILLSVATRTLPQNETMQWALTHGLRSASSPADWFGNVTLLYRWDTPLVIAQAWSLRVELVFYLLMIALTRHRWLIALWVTCSIAITAYYELQDAPFIIRYATVAGGSLAFSLGALVYHIKASFPLPSFNIPLAVFLFFGHTVFAAEIWGFERHKQGLEFLSETSHFGIHISVLLAAYLLLAINTDRSHGVKMGFDRTLGDLSYGVFLLHWICAVAIMSLGVSFENKVLLIPGSFVCVNVLAYIMHRYIERPIDKAIRSQLRAKARMRSQTFLNETTAKSE